MNINLSKKISYALRHNPDEFEIILDSEGWTDLNLFLQKMNCSRNDIDQIIKESDKQRFEIKDNKIRACYGHSTSQIKVEYKGTIPPKILYHGTRKSVSDIILSEGLKPMGRQYVHLSEDLRTARIVAKRWKEDIVIFKINAEQVYNAGVKFYKGNDTTWLCDHIDPKYIEEE